MQFIGDEGVTARRLEELARTPTNLNGMVRWGYITLGSDRVIRDVERKTGAGGVASAVRGYRAALAGTLR
jgi:hypothetical protein